MDLSSFLPFMGALPGFFGGLGGFGSQQASGPQQLPTKNKQQMQLLQQMLGSLGAGGQLGQAQGQGLGILQQYLDPNSDIYKNFEAPFMQKFEQQTVPGLAERFAGMGAMGGGLSSSGFGQALSSAGSNLQTQLAAMKSGLQRSAINDIFGQYNQMANLGIGTDPFAYYQQQQVPSGMASASNALIQMLPYLMSMA